MGLEKILGIRPEGRRRIAVPKKRLLSEGFWGFRSRFGLSDTP
jgi:hypothetical protein